MRITIALMAALLAMPVAASAEFITGTRTWSGKVAPRGEAGLRTAMLERHNAARRAFGSAPLVWDVELAADALAYARKLARTRRFAHSRGRGDQGENLFMGTRGAFTYAAIAQLWIDEQRDFRRGRFPDVTRGGLPWSRVAHYTAIVWPTTTRVGCGLASDQRDDFLVCRYSPAGNVFGTILR